MTDDHQDTPDRERAEPVSDDPDPGRHRQDERRGRSPGPDPDAPGNYVDDDTASEVPEPNEPG